MSVIFHAVDAAEDHVFTTDEMHPGDIVESEGTRYLVPNEAYVPASRINMPGRIAAQVFMLLGYQGDDAGWQAPIDDFQTRLSHVGADYLPDDVKGRLDRLQKFAHEAKRRGAVRVFAA